MQFIIMSFDFRTAPGDLRERLAFPNGEAGPAAARLLRSPALLEAAVLATCQRLEVYAVAADPEAAAAETMRFLAAECRLPAALLARHVRRYTCQDAVEHLFRLAAGLESLLLGENEILGQVKGAFKEAQGCGATGTLLNKLFMMASEVGKQVRARTRITRGHTSLAGVAVAAVRATFPDLDRIHALVLGAGQISENAARLLVEAGVGRLAIANRTASRAQELADRYGAVAVDWAELRAALAWADAVIVGTAAPQYLLGVDELEPVLAARPRPLACVDLAVPRNLDPAVASLPGVQWRDLAALEAEVRRSLDCRGEEVAAAEALIHLQMDEFLQWFNGLDASPTIAALRDAFEAIRQAEVQRLGSRWSFPLADQDRETLDTITRGILNKILHGLTMRLKDCATPAQQQQALETVAQLFGLAPPSFEEQYRRQRRAAKGGQARQQVAFTFDLPRPGAARGRAGAG